MAFALPPAVLALRPVDLLAATVVRIYQGWKVLVPASPKAASALGDARVRRHFPSSLQNLFKNRLNPKDRAERGAPGYNSGGGSGIFLGGDSA